VNPFADAWGNRGSGDACLRVWLHTIRVHPLSWPPGARVLEIGCQDVNWLTMATQADPSIVVTGIDWRGAIKGPGTRLRGDVLTQTFAPGSFDAIAMISTVEHIGLGHYQNDPLHACGDTETMERCAEWLAPGGWVYADVPYSSEYRVFKTKCRIYNQAAVLSRLTVPGLTLEHQGWYDLQGRPVAQTEAESPHETLRPFDYTALVWRKASDG
jgi:hypothetical protein